MNNSDMVSESQLIVVSIFVGGSRVPGLETWDNLGANAFNSVACCVACTAYRLPKKVSDMNFKSHENGNHAVNIYIF